MREQVTAETMKLAKKDAIFMNCLPAIRGEEQTGDVLDGPQSARPRPRRRLTAAV